MCIRDSNYIDHYTNKVLYTKHKAIFQDNTIVRGELLKSKIYTDTAALTANTSVLTQIPLLLFPLNPCLLYTSDAADERSSVDLGGRRIIKKKKKKNKSRARLEKQQNHIQIS